VKETNGRKSGLGVYENTELPMFVDGNIYLNGAQNYKIESTQMEIGYNPNIQIEENEDGTYLSMDFKNLIFKMKNSTVTTELLGKAKIPNLSYENPDGTPIIIDVDYFGNKRNKRNPSAGPFEKPGAGKLKLKVWEK